MTLLLGNHEFLAASLLQWLGRPLPPGIRQEDIVSEYRLWIEYDGGHPTYQGYHDLTPEKQAAVMSLIRQAPYHIETKVSGQHFHLSHTLPEYEVWRSGCRDTDFITGEPDYEVCYSPDRLFITGHTPTGQIEKAFAGRILRKNNHIAIDCGAVFGNPLGCIRLDDLKEFYV